ncbi:hypothetical protein QBE52_11940 [Clostridiaceae bacterium 35-E11]
MDQWNHTVMLKEFMERYDYAGAVAHAKKMEIKDEKIISLLNSCKHAMNFDFRSALNELWTVNENTENNKKIEEIKTNLQNLIDGQPDAIFSELIENTSIQLTNHQYIDFLSRVYRLKEAIMKYIFVKSHINKNKFSFMSEIVSKRMILKVLRKKYKIYNPNLSFAIASYVVKYLNKDKRYSEVLAILDSNKMNEIIELRHECIAGHGFKGVNRESLTRIYGNPDYIIDDFLDALGRIGVRVHGNKYKKINGYIWNTLENMSVQ